MVIDLFSKHKIPHYIPNSMDDAIEELKKSKSREECLRKAYDFVSKTHRGYRTRVYTKFVDLFMSHLSKI